MSDLKTQQTDESVEAFLEGIAGPERWGDCLARPGGPPAMDYQTT